MSWSLFTLKNSLLKSALTLSNIWIEFNPYMAPKLIMQNILCEIHKFSFGWVQMLSFCTSNFINSNKENSIVFLLFSSLNIWVISLLYLKYKYAIIGLVLIKKPFANDFLLSFSISLNISLKLFIFKFNLVISIFVKGFKAFLVVLPSSFGFDICHKP